MANKKRHNNNIHSQLKPEISTSDEEWDPNEDEDGTVSLASRLEPIFPNPFSVKVYLNRIPPQYCALRREF